MRCEAGIGTRVFEQCSRKAHALYELELTNSNGKKAKSYLCKQHGKGKKFIEQIKDTTK